MRHTSQQMTSDLTHVGQSVLRPHATHTHTHTHTHTYTLVHAVCPIVARQTGQATAAATGQRALGHLALRLARTPIGDALRSGDGSFRARASSQRCLARHAVAYLPASQPASQGYSPRAFDGLVGAPCTGMGGTTCRLRCCEGCGCEWPSMSWWPRCSNAEANAAATWIPAPQASTRAMHAITMVAGK